MSAWYYLATSRTTRSKITKGGKVIGNSGREWPSPRVPLPNVFIRGSADEETPILVVEVLSDSTRQRDLLYKRETYQELGVRYYLIVDPRNESCQLLVNGEQGYESTEDRHITLDQGCGFGLALDGLFD